VTCKYAMMHSYFTSSKYFIYLLIKALMLTLFLCSYSVVVLCQDLTSFLFKEMHVHGSDDYVL
jgi:uncharacterized membrane protein